MRSVELRSFCYFANSEGQNPFVHPHSLISVRCPLTEYFDIVEHIDETVKAPARVRMPALVRAFTVSEWHKGALLFSRLI